MGQGLSRLFFVISGEHPSLPKAELVAILETIGFSYTHSRTSYKLVELEADPACLEEVVRRGGFVDEAGIEIFHSPANYEEILDATKSAGMDDALSKQDSFCVRVNRFGENSDVVSSVKLESLLGGLIAKKTGARVNLRRPNKIFRGVISGGEFHFGQLVHSRVKGFVARRRPRERPAFHPSTMVPKLARCMVNLSHPPQGGVFLDPFCGVGGILIEASFLGCQVVGVDALARMLRGARRNLAHFGLIPFGLIRGDARTLPLREADAVATDPPYGTGASTLRSTTRRILENFLPKARDLLTTGKRLVVASPVGTNTADMSSASGFNVVDSHQVYVHRSLTREILVLEAA